MRIGKIVKLYIEKIFHYCDIVDTNEIARLMDISYSRKTFRINYPFCAEAEKIKPEESMRYWSTIYNVGDKSVRVSSQWYERLKPHFCHYIISKNIATEQELEQTSETTLISKLKTETQKSIIIKNSFRKEGMNSRYRGNAIGNAQNLFIRHILSNLGHESFNESDWKQAIEYFQYRCAYCDEKTTLVMDHAIPINRKKLGEHRIGNLIPCCKVCNERKAEKDYSQYLENNKSKINKIKTYMDERKYIPLGDNEQIQKILEMAYREVALLADRYVTIINELIPNTVENHEIFPKTDDISKINQEITYQSISQISKPTHEKAPELIGFIITKDQSERIHLWENEVNLLIAQKQLETGVLWNGLTIRESILKMIKKSIEMGKPSPYYGAMGGAYSFNFVSSESGYSLHVKNNEYGQTIDLGRVSIVNYENNRISCKIQGREYRTLLEWQQCIEKKLGKCGTYKYSFSPNGLGESKTVLCSETNQTVDLTNYSEW